jgi:hypothetical protein
VSCQTCDCICTFPLTNARSGELNAKNRELLELQAQARMRLAKTRANFADGMKAAKDVQRDLEWTQKKVAYVVGPWVLYSAVY